MEVEDFSDDDDGDNLNDGDDDDDGDFMDTLSVSKRLKRTRTPANSSRKKELRYGYHSSFISS